MHWMHWLLLMKSLKNSANWLESVTYMEDLYDALKHLDNEKSRDADGLANEIFKVAGDDLKLAVLNLMNLIKKEETYPTNLQRCNITSIHKKKSKSDFCNYRGGSSPQNHTNRVSILQHPFILCGGKRAGPPKFVGVYEEKSMFTFFSVTH